jgi:hypothetical protein
LQFNEYVHTLIFVAATCNQKYQVIPLQRQKNT